MPDDLLPQDAPQDAPQGEGEPQGAPPSGDVISKKMEPIPQDSWLNTVDESLRNNDTLRRFKDVNNLAKSYVEIRKTLGDKLSVPKEGDADSVSKFLNDVHSKLPEDYHIPEKPDDYKVSITEKDSDGNEVPVELNEKMLSEIQKACHQAGIRNDQFNKLVQIIYAEQTNAPNQAKAQIESFLKEQKKKDLNTPDIKQFTQMANKEYAAWPEDLREAAAVLPRDVLSRIAYHYASQRGEDTTPSDSTYSPRESVTDLQLEMRKIMETPGYMNEAINGPLHTKYRELKTREMKIRNKGR